MSSEQHTLGASQSKHDTTYRWTLPSSTAAAFDRAISSRVISEVLARRPRASITSPKVGPCSGPSTGGAGFARRGLAMATASHNRSVC